MKVRQNLYFDPELSRRLDKLAARPGSSKSAILEDALKAHLDRQGGSELADKIGPGLDRMMGQLTRIERNQKVLIETLALYVRFHFSVLPPLPEADQSAGRLLAQERYQAFIEQVGRRLAGQKGMAEEILDRAAVRETKQ